MKDKAARFILPVSIFLLAAAGIGVWRRWEPFHTYFFLFAWWSAISALDSWLYLKGGESILIAKPLEFFGFTVPLSAFLWFVFEAFNLRLQNWSYVGVPQETAVRWLGTFFAFGTVLPGIFITANLLEWLGLFRKNEFSIFFNSDWKPLAFSISVLVGTFMLLLPLIWPRFFFPLVWGGFVFLLDPWVALWKGKSLFQEWRQRNFNRAFQLLLAGLICGGLWEFWNFWAGAQWVYSVPLPESLLRRVKIFEMPLLGFLGFPPFALECFVMAEFVRALRQRISTGTWRILTVLGWVFMIGMCRMIDLRTVRSFRGENGQESGQIDRIVKGIEIILKA